MISGGTIYGPPPFYLVAEPAFFFFCVGGFVAFSFDFCSAVVGIWDDRLGGSVGEWIGTWQGAL